LIDIYDYQTNTSPEEQQLTLESKLELHRTITELKQTYRDVVVLRGIEELSVAETADILKWCETKVRVTYHRELKDLKTKVEEKRHAHKRRSTQKESKTTPTYDY